MTLAWESPKAHGSPDTEVNFEESGEVREFLEVKLRGDLGVTAVRSRDWHSYVQRGVCDQLVTS